MCVPHTLSLTLWLQGSPQNPAPCSFAHSSMGYRWGLAPHFMQSGSAFGCPSHRPPHAAAACKRRTEESPSLRPCRTSMQLSLFHTLPEGLNKMGGERALLLLMLVCLWPGQRGAVLLSLHRPRPRHSLGLATPPKRSRSSGMGPLTVAFLPRPALLDPLWHILPQSWPQIFLL